MSDAIEVLKDLKRQYSDYCNEYQLEDDNKFIDALDEALLALEQKEKLIKYCNELEANNKNAISKALCWEFIGTCKVKQILGIKKDKGVSK